MTFYERHYRLSFFVKAYTIGSILQFLQGHILQFLQGHILQFMNSTIGPIQYALQWHIL